MPCYNHSRYLNESIEGVLWQSYDSIELIIVDDFSNDNSIEIIETYKKKDNRIKSIYHNINLGVSKSRNDAISVSKGKYIAFCDADDIWGKNKAEIQIECLENNSEYDVIFCDSIIINDDGVLTGKKFSDIFNERKNYGDIFNSLCLNNFINTPTVLYRRSCLKSNLYFNEDFKYLEDWIYWIELAREHRFYYIDLPMVKYRVHNQSTNKDEVGYYIHRVKCYKYIVEQYPDLKSNILSEIYYNIGINYLDLEEKQKAKDYLLKSFRGNIFNVKNLLRIMLLYFR